MEYSIWKQKKIKIFILNNKNTKNSNVICIFYLKIQKHLCFWKLRNIDKMEMKACFCIEMTFLLICENGGKMRMRFLLCLFEMKILFESIFLQMRNRHSKATYDQKFELSMKYFSFSQLVFTIYLVFFTIYLFSI